MVFVFEVDSKTLKIQPPTLVPDTKIQILTVNESVVVWFLLLLRRFALIVA